MSSNIEDGVAQTPHSILLHPWINRLNEVKADTPCKARLSVILLESGVGAGDVYTSVNLQAVLYATAVGNFSNVF